MEHPDKGLTSVWISGCHDRQHANNGVDRLTEQLTTRIMMFPEGGRVEHLACGSDRVFKEAVKFTAVIDRASLLNSMAEKGKAWYAELCHSNLCLSTLIDNC